MGKIGAILSDVRLVYPRFLCRMFLCVGLLSFKSIF